MYYHDIDRATSNAAINTALSKKSVNHQLEFLLNQTNIDLVGCAHQYELEDEVCSSS